MSEKMKKYIKSVERRLNLPRDVKARVISDFESSILARQEAGMSEEEIVAELGSPKKAAADLNEQMKEFAYRKSPWRFVFAAAAFLSAVWIVLSRVLLHFGMILETFTFSLYPNESASIGIIGGADGPTAIFVTGSSGFDWDVAIMAVVMIVSILIYFRLKKCGQKE